MPSGLHHLVPEELFPFGPAVRDERPNCTGPVLRLIAKGLPQTHLEEETYQFDLYMLRIG